MTGKVLFVDIDGVCNNTRTTERFKGFLGIDHELVTLVNQIVNATECVIVLSSTWRLSLDFLEEVRRAGVKFADRTDSLPGKMRGDEVNVWLMRNTNFTERYAILDDVNDFYPLQPLFQTNIHTGLTVEIAREVIKHLNGGASE